MELLQSIISLLALGQALCLAATNETEETIDGVTHSTIAYSLSEPQPELFAAGSSRLNVTVRGCTQRNGLACCVDQPMPLDLPTPRLCSDFGSTQCCYMLPGRHQRPRVPRDLMPLLPTLTAHGQCEQRRRGRRVLHCCRGVRPQDPNPTGRAARICSDVGTMTCCYYPFAGHKLALAVLGSGSDFVGGFAVKIENYEGILGDRPAYIAKRFRGLFGRV